MPELVSSVFSFLNKNIYVSMLIFALIGLGIAKFFDINLIRQFFSHINYFRNIQNWQFFQLASSGLVLLLAGLMIKVRFPVPFSLYIASCGLILVGLIGLIPFSFVKAKSDKKMGIPPIILKWMGIGALLLSIFAFLFGFLIIFKSDSKDIPIAIVMGIVCLPAGVLLGVFLGMVVGYIIRKTKSSHRVW